MTRQIQRILVIDPNASAAVTRAIDAALVPLRISGGPGIAVDFPRDGPPGVITRQDADSVIALSPGSVKRQQRYARLMGVGERYAGSAPANLLPAETADEAAGDRLVDAGRKLVEHNAADVLILGCAGMSGHRKSLEDSIGGPVVEPTQHDVAMALGRLLLGHS